MHYSIVEEMRKDSVIANIGKDLGLEINNLSSRKLRITSQVSEKYFYLNLDNGNLYVKGRIDRETLCKTAATCFLSFDAVVENPFNIVKVKIEISDINDNSPSFFHEVFSLHVTETTSVGTGFALQSAEDPDIGVNSVQTYKLNDNQHFAVTEKARPDGTKYPEIVLENPLDRESQNIHTLTLTALDGVNPVRSGSAHIKIIVTDVNDNFPVFLKEIYKVSVNENIPINTTVITVNATDKDEGVNAQITYSFGKTLGNVHHTGMFTIHPTNGEIKVNRHLDFEETRNYELSVQAKDGGGSITHCKILIEIIDVNDNEPKILISSLSTPIPEDSAIGTMIVLIEIHDLDSWNNGEVDCWILESVPFDLILTSGSYYRIATQVSLDREQQSSYNITIIATDRGSPPLSSRKTIRLDISDVNDNPPVFEKSSYVAYVSKNNFPGASIYRIQALDFDIGENSKITYSISSTNTTNFPVSSFLSINIETGILYAEKTFDYEQEKEFQIQVTATDSGSPSLSGNSVFMIRIVDQNDNVPEILYPLPESAGQSVFEMVPFSSERGSLITKVVTVDADSGHNSWLSYHFIQVPEPSIFIINEKTGEIRTSHVFHDKDVMNHKVVVMVKDNGIPSLSTTITISLVVANNFQQVVPKISNQMNEDSQTGLQLYLVIALALISFLFIVTVMLVIISKFRGSKHKPIFESLSTSLYPPPDVRMLSTYSDGTLPFPLSYNICVALDSAENNFTYVKSDQNVPEDNLIDGNDLAFGSNSANQAWQFNYLIEHNLNEQQRKQTAKCISKAQETYQLSDDQYFTVNEKARPDGTKHPEIVLEKSLDREAQNIHTLHYNYNSLIWGKSLFLKEMYKVSLSENMLPNTTVITVTVTNRDEGGNAQITYSFIKTLGNVHHTETGSSDQGSLGMRK
ncbi:protocadherin gamma-B1-like [Lithobates pipiens]